MGSVTEYGSWKCIRNSKIIRTNFSIFLSSAATTARDTSRQKIMLDTAKPHTHTHTCIQTLWIIKKKNRTVYGRKLQQVVGVHVQCGSNERTLFFYEFSFSRECVACVTRGIHLRDSIVVFCDTDLLQVRVPRGLHASVIFPAALRVTAHR